MRASIRLRKRLSPAVARSILKTASLEPGPVPASRWAVSAAPWEMNCARPFQLALERAVSCWGVGRIRPSAPSPASRPGSSEVR